MAAEETETSIVHQVAYIFDPSDDEDETPADHALEPATPSRRRKNKTDDNDCTKRRKKGTPKKAAAVDDAGVLPDAQDAQEQGSLLTTSNSLADLPPLLQGRESPAAVARRGHLYSRLWSQLDARIQSVLQRSNDATLAALLDFVASTPSASSASTAPTTGYASQAKLPAAFIVLGPAATTDMLLFRQLAASLAASEQEHNRCVRRMVRLRASDCASLRAALRIIVQEATTVTPDSTAAADDDVVAHNGHKYLAYDLEAVATAIPANSPDSRIVVAFEDCEAFDGALLADLLSFLHSWLDRIPFVLMFGVATSIDLFQGRLPKQAAHRLAAAQFDVAPSSAVLDKLVRRAVAAADVPLRLGPTLVRSLAERQDEQVTGVSVFVNSLKYAYMCFFYANPLSVLLQDSHDASDAGAAQALLASPDYPAAVRQLPSFRKHVEAIVADGRVPEARALLGEGPEADAVVAQAAADQLEYQRQWTRRMARALLVASSSGVFADQSFTELYISAMEDVLGKNKSRRSQAGDAYAFTFDQDTTLATTMTAAIRRMPALDLVDMARRIAAAVHEGDDDLALEPVEAGAEAMDLGSPYDARWAALATILSDTADRIEALQQKIRDEYNDAKQARRRLVVVGPNGVPQLRSKYTAATSKAVRTTVVAQKVQLSRDATTLTDDDQAFTEHVDTVAAAVASVFDLSVDVDAPGAALWLHEVWLYDSCTPYRGVFIPRPGLVVERALARPHDYLACECCGSGQDKHSGGIRPTLPPTAILYQLYQDAGPLINVADLWEAFRGVVSAGDEPAEDGDDDGDGDGDDEAVDGKDRRHLVQFYQGMSEMKTLGYVKPTRRKVDHVAKIKWL